MQLSFVTDAGRGPKALTAAADVLDRLVQEPAVFRPGDQATFNVVDLALPDGRTAPCPGLVFIPSPVSEIAFAALLAPARYFRATDIVSGQRAKYDVRLLQGAVVGYEGDVALQNGKTVHAIEVIPIRIPTPSKLDWQMIKALIAAREAQAHCYRSVLDGLEPQFAEQMPELANDRRIDCARLSSLAPQLLKQDLHAIRQSDPELRTFTQEKLAQTLAIFGIRARRPRRPLRLTSATELP